MSWPWSGDGRSPAGLSDEEDDRLKREQVAHIITEVWPKTPHPSLRRRTPLQAGQAGDSRNVLARVHPPDGSDLRRTGQAARLERAAVEASRESRACRSIPRSVEIDQLHLSRLAWSPSTALDDDRLLALYRQSAKWGLRRVRNQAARLIDQRPSLLSTGRIELINLYGDLALEAAQDGDRATGRTLAHARTSGRVAAETLGALRSPGR